ncbi:metal ABC transporter solute-binding protein, Zn/Mn family [Chthonobacter albigriseus]|uniref:metal ABC transporter solute-binding protein, Zn/Mn family n=1 Tax=Chthonobacter albigriseus TaxID=1683161 RepID=UPI0015EF4484|nr:zinc ABC transporter substrate-binding protein [Chthonobacter albigriseus]
MKTKLLASLAVIATLSPGHAFAEPLKAVATFTILGDMVARVGGERVAVTTLVGPNGDAHVYQPTPRDARTVAGADVVVVNGLGFEGFLDRLIKASEYKGPIVTAAAGIKPIEGVDEDEAGHENHAEAGHEDGHDHEEVARTETHDGHDHEETAKAEHEDGHDHGAFDPHAWQSVANAVLYVEEIRKGLCAADAEGCPVFQANAEGYVAELKALDTDIRSRVAAIPAERRKIVTSHDAFGYFGREYGVTFLAPQGVSTDAEASAQDVAKLIAQVKETGVKTLFLETMVDPRLVEQIGREAGATVGGSLFSDALSGPGEGGETYIEAMKHNADALVAAMNGGS